MKLLGLELRRPTSNEVTLSGVVATGGLVLALLFCRLCDIAVDREIAAVWWAVLLWGAIGNYMGLSPRRGPWAFTLNVVGSATIVLIEGFGKIIYMSMAS